MFFVKRSIRTEDQVINALYYVTFFIHLMICYYFANTEPLFFVSDASEWFRKLYGKFGIDWRSDISIVMTASILSGLFFNMIRRILEGILLSWPRFPFHNDYTFYRSGFRFILYFVFVFFVAGAIGTKYSKALGIFDVFFIATGTYLVGLVVNVLDDFVSSTMVYWGRYKL